MSKTTSSIKSDYGYLNILINNNTNDYVPAEYNETRLQPIVTDMSNWQIGITRLKIPTTAIPLMIFEDDTYKIGLVVEIGGILYNFEKTVTYDLPDNSFTSYPYNRYVFYYNQFLTCVNNALSEVWNDALSTPALSPLVGSYNAVTKPYFRLKNNNEGYIELVLPCIPTDTPSSPFGLNDDQLKIYMNNKLFYFFSGFASRFDPNGFYNLPNCNYELQLQPSADSLTALPLYNNYPIRYVNVMQQDYPSLFLWQELTRIFITTTAQVDKEVILISGDQGLPRSIEVLTDFEIPQTQQGLREYIFYQPQGNLRFINFKSTGWLDRFDCKVFFQTKDLRVFQLIIPPTFEMNIKIEFKRRKANDLLRYNE